MNILVSTPGRLVDHLGKTESLRLDHVEWVVLDEADRMLELGYERDVRAVLDALQLKNQLTRQSVLLSATLTQVSRSASEKQAVYSLFPFFGIRIPPFRFKSDPKSKLLFFSVADTVPTGIHLIRIRIQDFDDQKFIKSYS